MNWSNRKTVVAAIIALLLCSGTTGLVTYHLARHRNADDAMAANSPTEHDVLFLNGGDATESFDQKIPMRGGRLRIVTSDGNVVTTNGTHELVVVEDGVTNSLQFTPTDRSPRTVRRYRVRTSASNPDGAAGFGAADAGGAAAPETPVPVPQ